MIPFLSLMSDIWSWSQKENLNCFLWPIAVLSLMKTRFQTEPVVCLQFLPAGEDFQWHQTGEQSKKHLITMRLMGPLLYVRLQISCSYIRSHMHTWPLNPFLAYT